MFTWNVQLVETSKKVSKNCQLPHTESISGELHTKFSNIFDLIKFLSIFADTCSQGLFKMTKRVHGSQSWPDLKPPFTSAKWNFIPFGVRALTCSHEMFSWSRRVKKSQKITSFQTLSPPLEISKTFPLDLENSFFRKNVQLIENIKKVSKNHQLQHIESTSSDFKNIFLALREFVFSEKCLPN